MTRRKLGRRQKRRSRHPPIEDIAAVAHRLAVLLGAGISPASAWSHLAAADIGDDSRDVLSGVAEAVDRGELIDDAIRAAALTQAEGTRAAWNGLAASWAVAADAGAPLSRSLRDFAESLRSLAQIQRDLEVALAGPVATARTVMILPAVGVLFGVALGFDVLRTLFLTPIGIGCLVVGALLMHAAGKWNRHLIDSATPRDLTPGLVVDLMAIAMTGGASIERARASVARARERFGIGTEPEERTIDAVLELASRAGIPAADLLRSEADQLRRRARSAGQRAAETVAAALMLPLGVCVLPAFLVVGVAPLLVSVISSTVTRF